MSMLTTGCPGIYPANAYYDYDCLDLYQLEQEDVDLDNEEEKFLHRNYDPFLSTNWPKMDNRFMSENETSSDASSSDLCLPAYKNPKILDANFNYGMMVNPQDCCPVFLMETSKMELLVPPKPYHPSQDHDYMKPVAEDDENVLDCKEIINRANPEPVVEVWNIEKFEKKETTTTNPVSRQRAPRRTSTRAADRKQREQARRISNAVRLACLNERPQRRQYKNIKPKNSVETTPSQSDIEEWSSQPIRPTYTKIVKKKTSKGRIDHSESERNRREVLRRNFSSLCDLIPNEYLRGEKASSQISKQKILNGAKAYILELDSVKNSYKAMYNHNLMLREKLQKKSGKLLKCVKKQK